MASSPVSVILGVAALARDDTVSLPGRGRAGRAGGGCGALAVALGAAPAFGLRGGGRAGIVQHELPLAGHPGRS